MELIAMSRANIQSSDRAFTLGFTLVELLVTIAVLGIIASLAVPSFREFIAAQRVKNASFNIMATLTMARSEALKRNGNVTITPAGGAWTSGWTITAPDGTALSSQNALPGLSIVCKTGSTTVACPAAGLIFASNGRLSAIAPSFELSNASTTIVRCISVDVSGRPKNKTGSC